MIDRPHVLVLSLCAYICANACSLDRNGRASGSPETGSFDAAQDAHVAPACTQDGTFCSGGNLYACTNRAGVLQEQCPLGCVMGSEARCAYVRPSNYSGTEPFVGSFALHVQSGELWVLNSTASRIEKRNPLMPNVVLEQYDANTIGTQDDGRHVTFRVRSVRVDNDGTLLARGNRPILVLAAESITVDGRLLAGDSQFRIDGLAPAGAGIGGQPMSFGNGFLHGRDGGGTGAGGGGQQGTAQNFTAPPSADGGGGGGGFCTLGGEGGGTPTLRGRAGASYGVATLEPISAGSGGGSGADDSTGPGGGGGGAIQLSAQNSIAVGATVLIDAGGGGCANGRSAGNGGGGSGGGSGGAILLEAPMVQINGHIAALGGGGGGAPSTDGDNVPEGNPGDTGRWTIDMERGGALGGEGGGGRGSNGNHGEAAMGASATNGSGGGGGAGRIRINSLNSESILLQSENFWPTAESGCVTGGPLMSQ